MEMFQACGLNNEALRLENEGDYEAAEKKHLAALKLKRKAKSETGVALTQNALGELYMKMGKLEKAQEMLQSSYEARGRKYHFNIYVTDTRQIILLKLIRTSIHLVRLTILADFMR